MSGRDWANSVGKVSSLDSYAKKPYQQGEGQPTETSRDTKDYEAFKKVADTRRSDPMVEVIYHGGDGQAFSYIPFPTFKYNASFTRIEAYFGAWVLHIEGENLEPMITPLRTNRIERITCFNSNRHDAPDDPKATIIRSLKPQELAAATKMKS